MIVAKSKVATFSIFVLLFAAQALAGKPDKGPSGLDCDGCVDSTDIAAGAVITDKIQDDAITGSKIAASAVGVTQVDPSQVQLRVGDSCAAGNFVTAIEENGTLVCNAPNISTLENDISDIESELDHRDAYTFAGYYGADRGLNVLKSLVEILAIPCADANFGIFLGCSSLTTGDGLVFNLLHLPISESAQLFWPLASRPVVDNHFGSPKIVVAQDTDSLLSQYPDAERIIMGGRANLWRWWQTDPRLMSVYADLDLSYLVDDCVNPTVMMIGDAREDRGSYPRFSVRVNGGGFYYIPFIASSDEFVKLGETNVSGQTVGVIKNIRPRYALWNGPLGNDGWCFETDQAVGTYSVYELKPYPFKLDEPRFMPPYTLQ